MRAYLCLVIELPERRGEKYSGYLFCLCAKIKLDLERLNVIATKKCDLKSKNGDSSAFLVLSPFFVGLIQCIVHDTRYKY